MCARISCLVSAYTCLWFWCFPEGHVQLHHVSSSCCMHRIQHLHLFLVCAEKCLTHSLCSLWYVSIECKCMLAVFLNCPVTRRFSESTLYNELTLLVDISTFPETVTNYLSVFMTEVFLTFQSVHTGPISMSSTILPELLVKLLQYFNALF